LEENLKIMYKTLITQDRLNVLAMVAKSAPEEGLFAELGVYKGGSLKFVAEKHPERLCLGFDTFSGLPKSHWSDKEIHQPGEFGDTSLEEVEKHIGLDNVKLVKGVFPRSAAEFEKEKFALVHCDFDFEKGIKACLDFFWPKLVSGGAIVFDDYGWPNCPGVKKIVDAFAAENKLEVESGAAFQAILRKP
jgi:O-methyltransferase